jgi:crotonobetaine/carnitine-CoA ligase
VAAGLAERGVAQGDHVAVWLFGGREGILTFFAINYLGAVFVPFNTAYKGSLLEHVLRNSDAELLVGAPRPCAPARRGGYRGAHPGRSR